MLRVARAPSRLGGLVRVRVSVVLRVSERECGCGCECECECVCAGVPVLAAGALADARVARASWWLRGYRAVRALACGLVS